MCVCKREARSERAWLGGGVERESESGRERESISEREREDRGERAPLGGGGESVFGCLSLSVRERNIERAINREREGGDLGDRCRRGRRRNLDGGGGCCSTVGGSLRRGARGERSSLGGVVERWSGEGE